MSSVLSKECHSLREFLPPYAEGRLVGRPRVLVEAHLATCPRCRAEVADLRAVLAALRSVPQEPLPTHLVARVQQAVAARPAPRPRLVWTRYALPLAAATGLFAIVLASRLADQTPLMQRQAMRSTGRPLSSPAKSGGRMAAAPAAPSRKPPAASTGEPEATLPIPAFPEVEVRTPKRKEPTTAASPPASPKLPRMVPGPSVSAAPPEAAKAVAESARSARLREAPSKGEAPPATRAAEANSASPAAPPRLAPGLNVGRGADRARASRGAYAPSQGRRRAAGGVTAPPEGRVSGGASPPPWRAERAPHWLGPAARARYRAGGRGRGSGPGPARLEAPRAKSDSAAALGQRTQAPPGVILTQQGGHLAVALRLPEEAGDQQVEVSSGGRSIYHGPLADAGQIILSTEAQGSGPKLLPLRVTSAGGVKDYTVFLPSYQQIGQPPRGATVRRYRAAPLASVLSDLSTHAGLIFFVEGPLDRPVTAELRLDPPKAAVEVLAVYLGYTAHTDDLVVYTLRPRP